MYCEEERIAQAHHRERGSCSRRMMSDMNHALACSISCSTENDSLFTKRLQRGVENLSAEPYFEKTKKLIIDFINVTSATRSVVADVL